MYSIQEIKKIRADALLLQLKAPAIFWELSDQQLMQICNGYGNDSMWTKLRYALTWVYRNYPAAAAIHDVEYHFSDGSEFGQVEADNNFEENLLIKWAEIYGRLRWMNPVAIYARTKLLIAVESVRKLGHDAWNEAFERRFGNHV